MLIVLTKHSIGERTDMVLPVTNRSETNLYFCSVGSDIDSVNSTSSFLVKLCFVRLCCQVCCWW